MRACCCCAQRKRTYAYTWSLLINPIMLFRYHVGLLVALLCLTICTASNKTQRNDTTFNCTPPTDEARLHTALLANLPDDIPRGPATPNTTVLLQHGFLTAWDFNQDEARAIFEAAGRVQRREAAEGDPECCMCHFGIAYSYGPYANKVVVLQPCC